MAEELKENEVYVKLGGKASTMWDLSQPAGYPTKLLVGQVAKMVRTPKIHNHIITLGLLEVNEKAYNDYQKEAAKKEEASIKTAKKADQNVSEAFKLANDRLKIADQKEQKLADDRQVFETEKAELEAKLKEAQEATKKAEAEAEEAKAAKKSK